MNMFKDLLDQAAYSPAQYGVFKTTEVDDLTRIVVSSLGVISLQHAGQVYVYTKVLEEAPDYEVYPAVKADFLRLVKTIPGVVVVDDHSIFMPYWDEIEGAIAALH